MIETYRFNCHGSSSPAYSCDKPYDNSGVYVQLEAYTDLQAKVSWWAECNEAMQFVEEKLLLNRNDAYHYGRYGYTEMVKCYKEAEAALMEGK